MTPEERLLNKRYIRGIYANVAPIVNLDLEWFTAIVPPPLYEEYEERIWEWFKAKDEELSYPHQVESSLTKERDLTHMLTMSGKLSGADVIRLPMNSLAESAISALWNGCRELYQLQMEIEQ